MNKKKKKKKRNGVKKINCGNQKKKEK